MRNGVETLNSRGLPSRGGHHRSLIVVDFGAESSRPIFSLSTLRPDGSPHRDARLTTGPPARALAGLDFHQLDSFERLHPLIWNSPLPSLLGAIYRLSFCTLGLSGLAHTSEADYQEHSSFRRSRLRTISSPAPNLRAASARYPIWPGASVASFRCQRYIDVCVVEVRWR